MESALHGIFTLAGFVSEISLVRCAHSFDFRYFTNSCENPVRARFPWSNLYFGAYFGNKQFAKTVVCDWTKRLYYVWETRFASLIGRSKIRNAFHTAKFDAKISVYIKYKKLSLILRTEKFWRLQGVANRWPCYSNLSRQSEFIGLISCKMQWCSHTPIPWKAWILADALEYLST